MIAAQTNIVNVKIGDILAFKNRGLFPEFDVLGTIITLGEGNAGRDTNDDGKPEPGPGDGDYTHIAVVRQEADPAAEVVEVRPGVFKILDDAVQFVETLRPTGFDEEFETVRRMHCRMGVKSEATWPSVQEWPIDFENKYMEVWRIREMNDVIAKVLCAMMDDQIGYKYDLPQFISFGNIRAAHAYICSQYASENVYRASLAVNTLLNLNRRPICLTPDVAGMQDQFITPNDLINSGLMYRIRHQGLRGV